MSKLKVALAGLAIVALCVSNCCGGDIIIPGMGPLGPDRCYNFLCLQIAKTVKCAEPMNKEDCPTCFRDKNEIKVIQDCLAKNTYTEEEQTKLCNGKARCVQKQFAEKCKKCAEGGKDYIHLLCNEELWKHMDCISEMGNSIMLKSIHSNGTKEPKDFCTT